MSTYNSSDLVARMAMEALNLSHRERPLAKRLFEQWLIENEDLRVAIADKAISETAARAISNDIRIERKDVLRTAERMPMVGTGVSVEAEVVPPRTALLPIPSDEASARRASRLTNLMGLHALPLPLTGQLMGEARAWEVKGATGYHWKRQRGESQMAQFYYLVWLSLPDRNRPASKQRPVKDQVSAVQLARLRVRAQRIEAKRTLSLGRGVV